MRLSASLLFLLFCIKLEVLGSQNWTHHTVLDGYGIFHLYWTPPEHKNGDDEIIFRIEMEAKGYFGLGFSPNGGMPGSDIVMGWVRGTEIYFQDRHADSFSLPHNDTQQDYELITAYENDTCTVFEFRRKLDTCDENDTAIDDSTMRVIYAYSKEDPTGGDPFYHGEYRGVKSVMLLRNSIKFDPDLNSTSLLTWDLTFPGVDISYSSTFYWCKIFKTPQVSEKHHIVKIEPLVEEGHLPFLHHMSLYECTGGIPEEYEGFLNETGHECWVPTMPDEMLKCQAHTATWSVGGEGMALPEHVGLPLEPARNKYYMFEIHYDNQQLRTGIIDHSGMRLYYTPKVRQFDAGSFMIGSPFLKRVFIPPGQDGYYLAGHSSPECVTSRAPESGIKVIAYLLHAHKMARDIKARHFRGSNELKPLGHDKNYDFNYQEFRYLKKEVEILPGDQITVECRYNSTQKQKETTGGATTKHEMCLVFILYYPLSSIYFSFSAPTFASINKVLGTNATSEADLSRAFENYNWTTTDIAEVQNGMRYSEQETLCRYGDYSKGEVRPLVSYPRDIVAYEEKTFCNATV